jgi:tetratricopeptide (TPR) repeat protein
MKLKKWLPQFALVAGVLLSYFNCLQNEFVWDDEFLIQKNTYLRSFEYFPKMLASNSTAGFGGTDNFYRPTQNIYYLLIYQAFGENKVAFHWGNIILHLLNALLLFAVLQGWSVSRGWAFATSLLWAVHPTHVEAISYISGTADPMGLLFFLLALWVFPLDKPNQHWKAWLGALLFFIISLLSKEAMIVVPALLMLVLGLVNSERRWQWRHYLSTLPFWITAVLYLILRKTLLNFDQTYSFYKTSNIYTENMHYRAYTFLATLPDYLEIIFWPVNLHMEREFPVFTDPMSPPVILGLALVVIPLLISGWLFLKRGLAWPLFGWLWFFGAFVPMMGVLVPVNSFILEHWLYLPSIAVFLTLGYWLSRDLTRVLGRLPTQFSWLPLGVTCVFFMICTHLRNQDWRTPISFYSNILEHGQGSARVHNNLAMAFAEEQAFQKAIKHYLKAIDLADAYPQTHYNLARAYIQLQQYEKAKKHLMRSLELKSDFPYSINLLKQLEVFLSQQRAASPE